MGVGCVSGSRIGTFERGNRLHRHRLPKLQPRRQRHPVGPEIVCSPSQGIDKKLHASSKSSRWNKMLSIQVCCWSCSSLIGSVNSGVRRQEMLVFPTVWKTVDSALSSRSFGSWLCRSVHSVNHLNVTRRGHVQGEILTNEQISFNECEGVGNNYLTATNLSFIVFSLQVAQSGEQVWSLKIRGAL